MPGFVKAECRVEEILRCKRKIALDVVKQVRKTLFKTIAIDKTD